MLFGTFAVPHFDCGERRDQAWRMSSTKGRRGRTFVFSLIQSASSGKSQFQFQKTLCIPIVLQADSILHESLSQIELIYFTGP